MKEFLITLLKFLGILVSLMSWAYLIGASFAVGYNKFKNKTKKVCDLCFRDIKKMNEYYKENKDELDKLLEEKYNK